ncbi:MAG TPA: hypothetical protein G4O13_06230 [Dehalococcoidia bacterium]|nr:hypothetical protein [Dehalococcoidia bacterium]
MGIVFLGVVTYIISTHRDLYDRLAERLPPTLTPTIFMLIIVIILPPVWGLFGLVAGALYHLAEDLYPDGGLGSPNFTFTLAIIILSLILTSLVILIRRRVSWRLGLIVTGTLACIFGWLLPLLANLR